ncbi:integrin alpha-M-like [Polymixia lowei]
MDRIITLLVYLSGFQLSLGFNVDPVVWKVLTQPAAGFGYQVVQRRSSLLVSAPLEQYSPNRKGQIYRCTTESCKLLPLSVPNFAVNMSLGLTLTSDPTTTKTMACGPTIPRDCKTITTYNGACWEINPDDRIGSPMPPSLAECRVSADIAFILDGSGSVSPSDFTTMKTFVKDLIRPLVGRDTQFSITQYSFNPTIHYYFNTFLNSGSWESNINRINQLQGGTYTAKAIRTVVENVFTPPRGSRANVKKVLIVITDGQSHDRGSLPDVASLAKNQGIVRFAIGVGDAFRLTAAREELNTIGSLPTKDHVFQVDNFGALPKIRAALQDSIFSIEGSQTSGDSLKKEMAQEGFSAAYMPGGGFRMGTVGAYQWRGGYQEYSASTSKTADYEPTDMEPDSYLGYSVAVARTNDGILTIMGAPRYKHRGIAMAFSRTRTRMKIDPFPWQFQTGSYFGAEVCTMDVDRDAQTDLVLISAPMFTAREREGRVYVCALTSLAVECLFETPLVLLGDSVGKGRFGSSVAPLPDLNSDRLNDLAVGAPLENDGQGSVYIFHGEGRRINPKYSQRIAGADVRSGLQFFGMSISESSFDLSGDGLPDLAVGSKGAVLLLRSKPIVTVEAKVSFDPTQIPTTNSDCKTPLRNTANICFTMTPRSSIGTAEARINYTFALDVTRKAPNHRAYFEQKQRQTTNSFTLTLAPSGHCFPAAFFIEACPEDALNELSNELMFTFEGLPSSGSLSPSLAQQAQRNTRHPLGFEINCGADNKCVDNLKVDFNFTGSSAVRVGIDDLLNVTVSVQNDGENSYNSLVILTYPAGLSFRKYTVMQGRVDCRSLDSEDGLSRGMSDCTIDKPIFKSNSKAFFTVSYGIDTNSELDEKMLITANATSGNIEHSTSSELHTMKDIDVKYSIFVSITSSVSYNNFTFGKSDLQEPVQNSVKVLNFVRAFNVTVVINVPMKLGEKDLWVDPGSIQIPGCQRVRDEKPSNPDFVDKLKKNHTVDCSVAWCTVFKCNVFMVKDQQNVYNISANISSGWIEQIGIQSAKFVLISTATLEYDRDQYIFFSTESQNNPPVRRIETEVEVYPETNLTKEIVGGSVGGLVLLGVITAGLYKAGFFKSQYKQMIADEGGAPDEAEPPAET